MSEQSVERHIELRSIPAANGEAAGERLLRRIARLQIYLIWSAL